MQSENFETLLDPFSEYALAAESDEYPKTDFTQLQLRGTVDASALSEAHDEALRLIPIFSSHIVEIRRGLFYLPKWVYDREVPNRLRIEDCRHMAGHPFDPMDFSTKYYALKTRRRIDLTREFPFNCSLLRVADNEYIFSILYHHSAMDARKAYQYLTQLLASYHLKITGTPPEWGRNQGMAALARGGGLVRPGSMARFTQEQLYDIWWKNRAGRISNIASPNLCDFRKVRGRHSLRTVIDNPDIIKKLLVRADKNKASLNDLLFAVAHKTLSLWNKEHDTPRNKFRFLLITNLWGRTELPEHAGAGVSGLNLASDAHGHEDIDALIRSFRDIRREQLRKRSDIHFHQSICRIVGAMRIFPMQQRTRILNPIANSIPFTLCLSNLGVVWPVYKDGRPTMDSAVLSAGDFTISDLHSSASIGRRFGIGLTTRIHNRRLYLNFVADCFRFRKSEFETLVNNFVAYLKEE